MKINLTIEHARRDLMAARNAAVAVRDWAALNRLTAALALLPVKGCNGHYVSVED